MIDDATRDRLNAAYENRCNQVRLASLALRQREIERICARFELESDEFFTAEQKAIRLIAASKRH